MQPADLLAAARSGGEDFAPLPGTRREVEALAHLFKTDGRPAQVLLGTGASEPELDRLAGAVVAIGNAPTALFRLLDLIDCGAPKPAAILGIPVGFVGAAEAKEALAADARRNVPFLTVRGRMDGSAMTAAALNALARPGI